MPLPTPSATPTPDVALLARYELPPGARRSLAMVGAHTEFSRLLAEHGLFGVGCLVLLGVITVRLVKGRAAGGHKALALAGLAWGFLFMTNAGMRIVAPSFFVGFAAITQGLYAAPQAAERRSKLFRDGRRSSTPTARR